jgi:TPR repeat protein
VERAVAASKVASADTAVALTVPVPVAAAPTNPQLSPQQERTAALLTSRGDAMLAIKDISAARKLYELATTLRSVAAATRLASTYDPRYMDKLGIIGMQPDVAMAVNWYDHAAKLGDRDAAQRMRELDVMLSVAQPAKTTP